MVVGILEWINDRRMERDMKMDAPFVPTTGNWCGAGSEQCVGQITIISKLAVLPARDDLVQIHRFCKMLQFGQRRIRGLGLQCRTQMDFADLDSRLLQGGESFFWLFKLNGEVTGVIVHTE